MSRKQMAARLKVVFAPEDGGWLVSIPEVQGCRSEGRSLSEARKNIREALATCVDVFPDAEAVAARAEFDEEIRLPAQLRRMVDAARAARDGAQHAQEAAKATNVETARALAKSGLSLRDAGELLGVSHQRAKQFAEGGTR